MPTLPPNASDAPRSLSFAEYKAIDAVNWSTLKHMHKSPLHYHYALTHPKEPTPAMILGSAIHCRLFEPTKFKQEYTVWTGDRRGKDWIAFKAAALEAGLTVLSDDDAATCEAIRESVLSHPIASVLLEGEHSEETVLWTDPETGIECKARLDHVNSDIVDLKSTANVERNAFARTIANMHYHGQMAFYREGWSHRIGGLCSVYLIAVEQAPPHDCVVYELVEEALGLGWSDCQRLLATLRDCRKLNQWPGRSVMPERIDLPAWVYGPEDESKVPKITLGEEIAP